MKKLVILLLFFCIVKMGFALKPSREYATSPKDYGMAYEEISIPTEDNMTLYGWFFKATDANSSKVIILSDDGNGNMADFIELASTFLSLGYNVVTYDYRGYGKSSNFEINDKFFIYAQFEKDLTATINWVKKYHSKLRSIHLYGLGIGGGLSLGVGANRTEVGKIIADSPYNTFDEVKKKYKEKKSIDILMPLGYNKNMLEPKYALEAKGGQLQGILLIAGDKDDIFTTSDVKDISKIRGSISSTYIVKGATSENTFSTNKDKYREELKKFVK